MAGTSIRRKTTSRRTAATWTCSRKIPYHGQPRFQETGQARQDTVDSGFSHLCRYTQKNIVINHQYKEQEPHPAQTVDTQIRHCRVPHCKTTKTSGLHCRGAAWTEVTEPRTRHEPRGSPTPAHPRARPTHLTRAPSRPDASHPPGLPHKTPATATGRPSLRPRHIPPEPDQPRPTQISETHYPLSRDQTDTWRRRR